MPLILGRSGCFHIAGWTGRATLAEAKKLSADVSDFRKKIATSINVHGICLLGDKTERPADDARAYMDQETHVILGSLATINYLVTSKVPFRSSLLMAILSSTFLMKGVGGRITCFNDKRTLMKRFTDGDYIQLTTKNLLETEIDRILREMERAGLPLLLQPLIPRGFVFYTKKSSRLYSRILCFYSSLMPWSSDLTSALPGL